jgi:hypothetical protein
MPLPRWVAPQLSKLVEKAPTGAQWVHEIKFDGFRMAARIERGQVQLLTRSGLDWTAKYPATAAAFAKLPVKTAYIDGELCGVRADGVTSFELMQQSSDAGYDGLVHFAFDLLELDGENVATLPLLQRKERLAQLLQNPQTGSSIASMRAATARRFAGRRVSMGSRASSPSERTGRTCLEIGVLRSRASARIVPSSWSSDGPIRKGHATSSDRSCWATTQGRERFRFYGARGGRWRLRRRNQTMERPMPKQNDLSRCLITLEQDATLIAVVEMGQASWLVAGGVAEPGIGDWHQHLRVEVDERAKAGDDLGRVGRGDVQDL